MPHWSEVPIPGGDGIRIPKPTTGGIPVIPRQVRRRRIMVGRQLYVAFDAHSLIEAESDTARPGHPV